MSISITSQLKLLVCPHCGCLYGIPEALESHRYVCPSCARRRIENAEGDTEEAWVEYGNLERQIRSLKGVIARMKKAGK